MKIGDRVIAPHGAGTIIGYDLPESKAKRYKVKIDESCFDFDPCYFKKDLILIHKANREEV